MTAIAALRDKDFARLDEQQQIYLDYTGAALSPSSLVTSQHNQVNQSILGNPHSTNPSSKLSTQLVENAREEILSFFNADPLKYTVVYTANASAAIKLVAESFPFRRGSALLLSTDNHNSVLGIREFARRAGANVQYIPLTSDLRLSSEVESLLHRGRHRVKKYASLFAYPAQSNFSGVKHPLSYTNTGRSIGWYTLLDAAAFVPSSTLDLSKCTPDFVPVSFYKVFGFPTGVGALIVRRDCLPLLRRPWFAGGTVAFSSVQTGLHALHSGAEGFEDGTLNFAAIGAISKGLQYMRTIGMKHVTNHVKKLTIVLLQGLRSIRWRNGRRAVRIYGPEDEIMRGGCVALDVVNENGMRVDARLVEKTSAKCGISLRVGCFCNPGAAEHALGIPEQAVRKCLKKIQGDFSISGMSQCVGRGYLGCVRVSVGLANNERDVGMFLMFLQDFCGEVEKMDIVQKGKDGAKGVECEREGGGRQRRQ